MTAIQRSRKTNKQTGNAGTPDLIFLHQVLLIVKGITAGVNKGLVILCCLLCTGIIPGCTQKPVQPLQHHMPPLVWPSQPETSRIQYLYTISSAADIGFAPSVFEKVLNVFAGSGKSRHIVRPHGIFFSSDEVLMVTDPGLQTVHMFDLRNKKYNQVNKYKKQKLVSPIGIVADEAGRLYISDSVLKKVFVFTREGKPLMELGEMDSLQRPTGIAVHSKLNRLYVVDTIAHDIKVFDLDGKYLFSFGRRGIQPGEFNYPTSINFDRQGNVYVNDSLNFRVQVFSPDGSHMSLFGKHGDGLGELSHPKGVALDSEGHIYIADAIFDAVQIFDRQGRLLLSFGEAGQGPGELWIPAYIFIDRNNKIFISDSYNQRIQVFQFLGGRSS